MTTGKKVLIAFVFIPLGVAFFAALGWVTMSLWNYLMPMLFGLRTISYWQAWGIIILAKILFGGFHGRRNGGGPWRHRMMQRWDKMTPEEREKFRAALDARCGRRAGPDAAASA